MTSSLAAWIADQVVEVLRPISSRLATDIAQRLRVEVTIKFYMDDEQVGTA